MMWNDTTYKNWMLAVLTVLLCWACEADKPIAAGNDGNETQTALTIVADEEPWQGERVSLTRIGESLTTLQEKGFGLFNTYLGLTNKEVKWKSEAWDFGSPLIWPNNRVSDSEVFLAYAPYKTGTTLSGTNGDMLAFPFPPTADNPIDDNTTDLMWSKGKVVTEGAGKGTVKLVFKHALGRLSFNTITNNYGETVTLTKITVTVQRYENGTLSLTDGEWTVGETLEAAEPKEYPLSGDSEEIESGQTATLSVPEILQIPGAKAKVKFDFTISGVEESVESDEIVLEQGKHKIVNVTIGMNHEVVIK